MLNDRMGLLVATAEAVAAALRSVTDWGPSGGRLGQYALDVVADDAALQVLHAAGVGVLSEESGLELTGSGEVVIIDPVDGSTNASRGVPYYATSLCLVDGDGPAAALVVNLATGVRYSAERGAGAWCDGAAIAPSGCTDLADAVVGLNGVPPARWGYAQSRTFGALALDLCLVASGVLDGYVDCVDDEHGIWDWAAGALICAEAGASVVDVRDRDLFELVHATRRTPVAAATSELLSSLVSARRGSPG
ncbi:MAG: inositol monophosphatase [Actinobacteria bacterium]|nr:inositol monophosphatase [Actinomycetota bacterium]